MDKRRRTHSQGKKLSEEYSSASQLHEQGNQNSNDGKGEPGDYLQQDEINLNQLLNEIKPSLNYFMNSIIEFIKGANIVISAILSGTYRKKIENLNALLPWLIGIITSRLTTTRKAGSGDGEKLVNAVIKGLEEEADDIINNPKSSKEDIFKATVLQKVVEILKRQVREKRGGLHKINIE